MIRVSLLSLALALSGAAWAHAELESASPAEGATVRQAPVEVTLTFSEPVETTFGLFKIYPLGAEVDLSAADAELRLNGLAGQLVADVLEAQGDGDARADTGVANAGSTNAEVTVPLKSDLAPGPYVVMWRVVSADTHPVEGFYTFVYTPAE